MRRRDFTKGIVGSAVASPLVARVQQPAMPVIGMLDSRSLVRQYIHENLGYRFILVPDAPAVYAVEKTIKRGEWEHGRPLLNPRG
jgi:hypothetical protein